MPPVVYEIPAGTPLDQCRSCKEPIYWIKTPAGRRMPVDPKPGPEGGDTFTGTSHFATCKDAKAWRKKT